MSLNRSSHENFRKVLLIIANTETQLIITIITLLNIINKNYAERFRRTTVVCFICFDALTRA